jgi:hypothetical protein
MKTTVRQTVRRLLANFRQMGDEQQKAEAAEIERLLDEQERDAVNFAREEEPATPAPEGKK